MELTEPIESINKQLIDLFGVDTVTGQAIWRVVWSEDQFEDRLGTYDDYSSGGIWLRQVTEVRRVPKYRQWIKELFVLERLVVIPEANKRELPDIQVSYEPLFPFWDKNGKYLPPKLIVAKFVIDTIYAAQGRASLARYKDPEAESMEASIEIKRKRIEELQDYLYGDMSGLHGMTITGESVIVPNNYERN